VFRARTDLVALQVTVIDEQHRYVSGLQAEDFGVLEEGVPQTVSLFAAGTAPLDLILVLDTSASMFARLPSVRQAAINFVRALKHGDRAAIILFNHRVAMAQPLTGDIGTLERVIAGATAGGGTALNDALYISLKQLARARPGDQQTRRQAIVVLTDGDDNDSHIPFSDVFNDIRGTTVTIYSIVPPLSDLPRDDGERPRAPFEMRSLAEETGGRAFTPQRLHELSGVYAEIAEELGQQYWLAYAPKVTSEGFRRVSVQIVSQPTWRARTRSGYHASGPRTGLLSAPRPYGDR
jgi:VWFA-related protein